MGYSQQAAERAYQAIRKNLLINGNFDVWQRGTSGGFGYNADRWNLGADGGGTFTNSRQEFSTGQTDVPNDPTYYARVACTVAQSGGTYNVLVQRIEDVRTAAGKTVSVSVWARGNAGGEDFEIALAQRFGTGGSPSSSVFYTMLTTTLTTSWEQYTATYTLPTLSGKTIGTDENSYLELELLGPINTTHQFDVAQAQVEIGNVPTDFEYRPFVEELTLCQRYYCKTFDTDTTPADYVTFNGAVSGYSADSGYVKTNFVYPVEMRTVPTITTYNPGSGGTAGYWRSNSDVLSSGPNVQHTSTRQCSVAVNASMAGNYVNIHAAADAEL